MQSLAEFEAVLAAALSLAPDFVTLSHSAWLDSEQTKEVATLEDDGRFPWASFQSDASKHPTDHVKGNMLLDRKYAPLLLELTQETAPSVLKPSRSPFNSRDGFAARIALSVAEDGASIAIANNPSPVMIAAVRGGMSVKGAVCWIEFMWVSLVGTVALLR